MRRSLRRLLCAAVPLCTALAAQGKPAAAEEATRIVEGRVVDVLGEPIPAATVAAVVGGVVVRRTMTDGEGIYRLSRVPAIGAEISFTAPGKVEVRAPLRGPASVSFRNETLEDAGRLHGRVRDAHGGAIAGATIVFATDRYRGEAVANARGDYVFDSVPLRRSFLRAWTPNSWAEKRIHLAAETRCDLTMPTLVAGARVVRVIGLPAEALATACVEVTSTDMVLHDNGGRIALRADGTAEVLPTECCIVQLVAPGFSTEPVGHFVCGGQGPIEFKVVRQQAARTVLKGLARDGRGRPIAGVRVVVRDRSSCDLCTGVTDMAGQFVLSVPLPPHSFCRIGLELREWQLVDSTMSIADGFSWIHTTADPHTRRDLFAEPTGGLHGEVRGESGNRLVFADVVAADVEQIHKALVRAVSDRAGRFEMRLPPGDYELLATASDGQVARGTVRVTASQPNPEITWTVLACGSIEGTLLDGSGKPAPGVELSVCSQELPGIASERWKTTVLTDRHGRFRCRGLAPGPWTVAGLHEKLDANAEEDVVKGKAKNIVLRLSR
ncbi:MAG TPA: carboxypeptidase-like regulatory domain-containing protein [Planctomycetota bacterium]